MCVEHTDVVDVDVVGGPGLGLGGLGGLGGPGLGLGLGENVVGASVVGARVLLVVGAIVEVELELGGLGLGLGLGHVVLAGLH